MSPPRSIQGLVQAVATLGCIVLIASCGGAGEVGSGGTGAALGTVTGFGSIIVDGVRFDDSNATVQVENVPDQQDPGEAKLGQRVEIDFETEGVARTVRIEPEVVGSVSATSGTGLTLLGQSVVINTDILSGPVTQFANGYASLADVKVSDVVEVHGVARLQGAGYVIQATRIEKRSAPPAYLRVAGIVSGLTGPASGPHFTLGGLGVDTAGAVVVPASRSLADGQPVVVWARAANLKTSGAGAPSLTANLVRIREQASSSQRAYLGGVVSGRTGTSFSLGGVAVNYANALVTPAGSVIGNGQYVQVRGDFAADGSLVASGVKIRDGRFEPDAELRGTVSGFDAPTKSFKVRDITVVATTAILDSSCPAGGLADGLFVEIKGRLSLTGIVALNIKCDSDEPAGAIVERRGVASKPGARTFTLTPTAGPPLEVRWTALTYFRDVAPDALDGKALRVDGILAATNTLIATKIRLDN